MTEVALKGLFPLGRGVVCLLALMGFLRAGAGGFPDSPQTVRVAAANSSAADKAAADLVCSGTNDERVLNAAIAKLTKGGTVALANGDYRIDAFEQEGHAAVLFGYNDGHARVVNVVGGTENKSYNTRYGVGIHVTEKAVRAMDPKSTYRLFYGTSRRPPSRGAFFTMTWVNNVNFKNLYILFHDASKPWRGIDGSRFGAMQIEQVGVYTERYFEDRFMHVKPATPAKGSIGIVSVSGSNDEMARIFYSFANVGGMHTGFLFQGVDHLILTTCSAARCCYGYRTTVGSPKTLTFINCCDEGNAHLPYFAGKGHLTAIDFNIERFNAAYIPDSPDKTGPEAAEATPGSWHGFVSYTMQGTAFGLRKFWKDGCGRNFQTVNLDHDRTRRSENPEYLEQYFDTATRKTYTWDGTDWVDAMGDPLVDDPHRPYDLLIYGGTSAGLAAAVQAKRMGLRAVVIEPTFRIGGLTTGGLGCTDIGRKEAYGGIALDFYRDVRRWYAQARHWKHQAAPAYASDGQCAGVSDDKAMWTFEPSAALAILEGWEKRDGLEIVRGERLDRSAGGVTRENGRIASVRMESGRVFRAACFIDATYEGDLMAAAGVTYTYGRESNATYGEKYNGIQTAQAKYHQFFSGVDPYVVKGKPESGLLPGVEPYDPNEKDGTGDRRVQAYCFRMCLTDVPENRIPFEKPAGYDERAFELLFRDYEQRAAHPEEVKGYLVGLCWINSAMPCRKTDTNNRHAFSTDFIGGNWNWPEASYAEREQIFARHLHRQKCLMWTLANHPRVPEYVRKEVSRWGLCKDEFLDKSSPGGGWQGQLYVREARRMVGEYVMTEHDCAHRRQVPKPVAKGSYQFDSHHVRRKVGADGFVHNEGDVEVPVGGGPYGIAYGALVPKRGECRNLLVPVCLSASHIAYGSIRMEPVFFALGQAVGTAAAIAVRDKVDVQDVSYEKLAARLARDGQVFRETVRKK